MFLFRLRCTSARLRFFRAQHGAPPPTHASELQPQPACITTAYLSRNSFGWMFAPSTMRSPTLGRRKRKMLSQYSSLGAASGDQLSLQTPCQTRLNCLWAVHQEPSLRRNKLDQVEYSVEHILSRPPPSAHLRLTLGVCSSSGGGRGACCAGGVATPVSGMVVLLGCRTGVAATHIIGGSPFGGALVLGFLGGSGALPMTAFRGDEVAAAAPAQLASR